MLTKLKNWLTGRPAVADSPPSKVAAKTPPRAGAKTVPGQGPERVGVNEDGSVVKETLDPGKRAPAQRRFIREDTGTHETLKILDDSIIDSPQDDGADPYNTGGFDRSKNWASTR